MAFFLILSTGLYLAFVLYFITGLFRHDYQTVTPSTELTFVSVVIAARNEEKNLPNLIHDLVNQEYPMNQLEIIFVNDRSTDATESILMEASSNYSFIKHLSIPEKSSNMTPKKNALTLGIESAIGEIIISTDADCRVPKFWVSSMAYSVVQNKGITIGYSSVKGESFFDQYQQIDFLGIISANAGAAGWGSFWSGTGQNLAYKKSDFESIGGFGPVKNKTSGDDMYLVQAISNHKSGSINIDPNSFVYSHPVETFIQFMNQRIRWSSNSRDSIDRQPLFFLFILSAFFTNALILVSIILGISGWGFPFIMKFIFEGSVIYFGGRLFETTFNPFAYCIWAIVQPFYIPAVGIMGIFNKYSWKP
jgi:cellulose synthase/poly-beta-1,6-N-acetylglucosamine synthase-like glycosyltransferase